MSSWVPVAQVNPTFQQPPLLSTRAGPPTMPLGHQGPTPANLVVSTAPTTRASSLIQFPVPSTCLVTFPHPPSHIPGLSKNCATLSLQLLGLVGPMGAQEMTAQQRAVPVIFLGRILGTLTGQPVFYEQGRNNQLIAYLNRNLFPGFSTLLTIGTEDEKTAHTLVVANTGTGILALDPQSRVETDLQSYFGMVPTYTKYIVHVYTALSAGPDGHTYLAQTVAANIPRYQGITRGGRRKKTRRTKRRTTKKRKSRR